MSGLNSASPRSRWGDDEDSYSLGQRSQYWSPGDGGAVLASSWGHGYNSNLYSSFPGQRCATPVHRSAPLSPLPRSPLRYAPAHVRLPPEHCQKCGNMSRTVASCSHSTCYLSLCIFCRGKLDWPCCDSCGDLVCSRHVVPYLFKTRECCGMHMLTADEYYLCGTCMPELHFVMPQDDQREDDATHGVFACARCGRDTCRHARFCRSCRHMHPVQARMHAARRSTAVVLNSAFLDKLSCLANSCLATDLLQLCYHNHEPELQEPPPVVHVPMRRAGGRRALTKHARRADPPSP